jgi:hypothetical protein
MPYPRGVNFRSCTHTGQYLKSTSGQRFTLALLNMTLLSELRVKALCLRLNILNPLHLPPTATFSLEKLWL